MIFKYGYMKAKMANFILFFVLIVGGSGLINYSSKNNDTTLNPSIINIFNNRADLEILLMLMVPLLLMLICSYFISLTFYKKENLKIYKKNCVEKEAYLFHSYTVYSSLRS
ncbi:ABC-2 transporter permease [Robertmurraya massiliosenegalensis]|uniref:ABC-2 transporter permease n=1 Tax=Robertmurraya massiliosenegalensis TaxID=1287657 RepID=UPI0037099815